MRLYRAVFHLGTRVMLANRHREALHSSPPSPGPCGEASSDGRRSLVLQSSISPLWYSAGCGDFDLELVKFWT